MAIKPKIINREISWLAFNERVLSEAEDSSVPLLERLKFLGIFSNNRDEFFRVRVASVKRWAALNEKIEATHDDPRDILAQIQRITIGQQQKYERIYQEIIEELRAKNVFILSEKQLNASQKRFVEEYYNEKVDPVISPIMLDQVKGFPHLRDKAIYLAAWLTINKEGKKPTHQYSLVEVPASLPRFIVLPEEEGKKSIIILDDVIRHNLNSVFEVFKPSKVDAYAFKITRDAELDLDNDISKSFLEKMKKSLKQRRRGAPVRFVFDAAMPKEMQRYLAKKMSLTTDEDAFIPGARYHNLKDLMSFPKINLPKAYYTKLSPNKHPHLEKYDNYFTAIKKKDVLLHYPYQSFNHVIEFLKEAALDPDVRSIRICLYRVAGRSKVINALINAARNGKKVVVVFELQARFDEENNIYWSNILEDEGVKVYFGFPGMKVHGKICLVTRKENGANQYYAKVGTGNFHEGTSALYGDLSLMTARKDITSEIHKVFDLFENAIWPNYRFKHLVLSPFYLRNRLIRLINVEIRNAKAGKPAYVTLKLNSLVDNNLINKLYQASKAGVKVRLIIRGICSLVPGIPGLSENIQVISIIDRFLEHARIYVFCNDNDPLYFISSADWMVRNLDRRIEVTCPIYDSSLKKEIDDVLTIQFSDNTKARMLMPDGKYIVDKADKKKDIRSQYVLHEYYKKKSKQG
ncbi:polyphosphate kinase 1 [Salibacteraceae bacterium]|nr:polyphosphate kinase 1 [Salibacteraceae bacterium]MDB9709593.1 polyphosphate kinase 1 [Salibacteraceae bacterium]MDC1304196.1 polyphosphate kinase 1 [Salibacteraceae bacterium]